MEILILSSGLVVAIFCVFYLAWPSFVKILEDRKKDIKNKEKAIQDAFLIAKEAYDKINASYQEALKKREDWKKEAQDILEHEKSMLTIKMQTKIDSMQQDFEDRLKLLEAEYENNLELEILSLIEKRASSLKESPKMLEKLINKIDIDR